MEEGEGGEPDGSADTESGETEAQAGSEHDSSPAQAEEPGDILDSATAAEEPLEVVAADDSSFAAPQDAEENSVADEPLEVAADGASFEAPQVAREEGDVPEPAVLAEEPLGGSMDAETPSNAPENDGGEVLPTLLLLP